MPSFRSLDSKFCFETVLTTYDDQHGIDVVATYLTIFIYSFKTIYFLSTCSLHTALVCFPGETNCAKITGHFQILIKQDACRGVHSACREEKGAQGGLSSKK